MPTINLSDIQAVKDYATDGLAVLKITSMITGYEEQFPAFLTDFSQTFTPKWNEEEVYGRMDPIASYQGTKRTMSLSFDVISAEQAGAKENMLKCQNLIQMTYPAYKDGVISRPPLIKVKFANLICDQNGEKGLLGWMDNLSWKPDIAMGMFKSPEGFYPKVINLSFGFNILHQQSLGISDDNKWRGGDAFPFGNVKDAGKTGDEQ